MAAQPAFLVFDVETVADGRLIQRVRYPDRPELSPAEAVALHRADLKAASGSDFIPHPFVVPVSLAVAKVAQDGTLLDVLSLDRPKLRPQVITRQFWGGWEKYRRPTLVTFNGRFYDLPVMEMCAYRYGLALPSWFAPGARTYEQPRNRYNTDAHFDLQDFLTNFGAVRQHGGLNLCAALLGKPGKMGTKGDMVQDLWEAGEKERIDDYCLCDALDTYFVFLRCRVLQGLLSPDDEEVRVRDAHAIISTKAEASPALSEYLQHFRWWKRYDDDGSPFLPDDAPAPPVAANDAPVDPVEPGGESEG